VILALEKRERFIVTGGSERLQQFHALANAIRFLAGSVKRIGLFDYTLRRFGHV